MRTAIKQYAIDPAYWESLKIARAALGEGDFAAAIPILPFGFLPVPQGRVVSAIVTTLLLVALGVGRARIGGRAIIHTVFETVSIGVAAALAGVSIGVFISHIFT